MKPALPRPVPVSIVIPVLNGGEWIEEQLVSLTRQTRRDFEVIVVDNGSEDDSMVKARAFADALHLVVVDGTAQRGQAFARNLGARTAKGSILLFLDQDDTVNAEYVETMVSGLAAAELVGARMETESLNPGWRAGGRDVEQTRSLPVEGAPWAYGCSLGVRRAVFERLEGFSEDIEARAGEDVDLCWRAAQAGFCLDFVPDAVVHYRFPESSRGFFEQGVRYGYAGALVRHRHGRLSPLSSVEIARSFLGPIRLVISPRRDKRVRGLFLLGRRIGVVRGLRQVARRPSVEGPSQEADER